MLRSLLSSWVLGIVTVVICGFFVAKAVGSVIAAETLTESPTAPPPRVQPPPPAPPPTKLDGTKITRNIFCSDCDPAPVVAGGGPAVYTGEPAVLIATMIGHEPRAIVRVLASEAQGSWGIGERIPGVGTIDRIGSTSIDVVDVAGHRGTLSLLDSAAGGQPKKVDAATSPAAAPDPFQDVLRKVAENDFEVDRKLVRDLVTGTTKAGSVRAMPVMRNGSMHVRLSGVKPGTVAAALELKNGDSISSIDGEPIKHAQQLLDLYAKLDQVSAVELGVTRGGKPFTMTLRLR